MLQDIPEVTPSHVGHNAAKRCRRGANKSVNNESTQGCLIVRAWHSHRSFSIHWQMDLTRKTIHY